MKIAFYTDFLWSNTTGVRTYVHNLLTNLMRMDLNNQYLLFYPHTNQNRGLKLSAEGNFVTKEISIQRKCLNVLWYTMGLPSVESVIRETPDIIHFPNHAPVPKTRNKLIVTIQDLSWLRVPRAYAKIERWLYNTSVSRIRKSASFIITISENTKQDIVDLLKISQEKIRVIYDACADYFRPITDLEVINRIRNKYCIPGKYILALGSINNPRKNIITLIKAFHLLNKSLQKEYFVVLCGSGGRNEREIKRLIRDTALKQKIIFTGYLPDEDLPALFSGAEVFVYPSLYEGFGLPILEAMSCGTPVIASNNSSISEIVGKAGLLVETNNIEALSNALCSVLLNNELRISLRTKGLERAKNFSWRRTAQETLAFYNDVYKSD